MELILNCNVGFIHWFFQDDYYAIYNLIHLVEIGLKIGLRCRGRGVKKGYEEEEEEEEEEKMKRDEEERG